MADNVAITAGSGTSIATDDAGAGGHVQLFKLAYSADGVATLVQVDANGLLVNTELPAAAALSDTTANPTAPMVGSALMSWDGTQWRRVSAGQVGSIAAAKTIPIVPCLVDQASTAYPLRRPVEIPDADPGWFYACSATMLYNGASWDRMRGDITNGLDVDVTRLPVPPRPATAALANVAASATSVTLQASNTARQGLTVVNDSLSILYLKYGSTASATSFTYKMSPGATLELPQPNYTGIVTGIWVTATGSARMTEVTA